MLFFSLSLSVCGCVQITSVAGIPQTAIHMSRVQFYSCLKLIAAHQATIPLRAELISSTMSLPLPKFSWKDSPTKAIDPIVPSSVTELNGRSNEINTSATWRKSRSPNLINLVRESQLDGHNNSDIPSTDSEVEHTDGDGERKVSVLS